MLYVRNGCKTLTKYKDRDKCRRSLCGQHGYSGTNFDRPRFKNMLSDIEDGRINCVITKDLSRLGRNYLQTGMYIEVFFPEHGIRYKNLKDPLDHNHLIVDERYAPVVRRIYALAKEGLGISKIRKILTDEKIPRPVAAALADGHNMHSNQHCSYDDNEENLYTWSNNSVRDILRSPVYAGHIAGQKRPKRTMKADKRFRPGNDKYFIVKNVHEPIVDPDDWVLVQRLITSRRKTLK